MAEQQQPREMSPVQPPAQRPVIARTLNVQGEGEMSPVQPPAQRPVMARTLNVQGEGGALPGQLPAQRAEAPSLPAPLPQAKGETGQSGGRRRHDHPAPASETRNEPSKETALVRRVEAVFLHLDKLAQQTTGDPNFTWIRSEKAKRAVKQLLADGRIVTPEKLAAVYLHMATMKPNPKTGFTWADKMSVTHVCENYDSIWLELAQAGQQPCLNDTSRGKTPLRTRVVYGCTEQEPTSQPLPVVALQRNTARRWLVEKGI